MFKKLINILFPTKCIFCYKILDNKSDINICESCFDKLPFLDVNDFNYSQIFKAQYCDVVVSSCRYEGIIKKVLADFKFRDRPSAYRALAHIILISLDKLVDINEIDLVTAVPLSRKRRRSRGYNQAGLLAAYLARELKTVNASSILVRTRDTDKQASLHRDKRNLNVFNAFSVIDYNYIKDKNVLVVDDIFTTGSTLSECAKALKNAGAAKVFGAVVASGRKY